MQKALALHQTTIGKKVIVAITGLVMFGYLVGHLLGNLQIFHIVIPAIGIDIGGPDKINAYGAFLHSTPSILWTTRIVLLASIALHVYYTIDLREANQVARTQRDDGKRYAKYAPQRTNVAALWMILTGSMILFFVTYHLLHLTLGVAPLAPEHLRTTVEGHPGHEFANVYDNVVLGFRTPVIALFYILANVLLGAHLFHGVRSLFQTLGFNHNRHNKRIDAIAYGLAGFITLGNVFIPTACLTGLVKPTTELTTSDTTMEH